MAHFLPQTWNEATFVEDISNHPELYDINEERYSNNEHHHSVFWQIGVLHNVDGKDGMNFIFIK